MIQYDRYQCQKCGLPTGAVCVGQGGTTCTCPALPSEPKYQPEYDNRPANKSHRFRPRMVWNEGWRQWLVQVHPEIIEVFNKDGEYLCQARWIDGKVDVSRGGLSLVTIQMMFEGRA